MDEIVLEIIRDEVVVVEVGQQGLPGRNSGNLALFTDEVTVMDGMAVLSHTPVGDFVFNMAHLVDADGLFLTITDVSPVQTEQEWQLQINDTDWQWLQDNQIEVKKAIVSYLIST